MTNNVKRVNFRANFQIFDGIGACTLQISKGPLGLRKLIHLPARLNVQNVIQNVFVRMFVQI